MLFDRNARKSVPQGLKATSFASCLYGLKPIPTRTKRFSAACLAHTTNNSKHSAFRPCGTFFDRNAQKAYLGA
jgi:hypothetical protein